MSKEEAVKELLNRNIVAENENGIVMVYSDTLSFEDLKRTLAEIGYTASHGLRPLSWKKSTNL